MTEIALLTAALMFGGMTLYSFGFAAFVFTALPPKTAGPLIRRAFPHFYLFVLATSVLAAVVTWFVDPVSGVLMAAIALSTLYARQVLMPAINAATDAGAKARFKWLHSLSVIVTLSHIAAAAVVLLRLASA